MSETQPTPGQDQYDGTCEDRRLTAAGYVVCGSGADTQWHWMDPSGVWHDTDARGRFYRQEHVAVRDALGHLAGERPTEPEDDGSPPSSKTEHVAGDAVSGAVEAILRQAVEPEEYAKSAHRFFEAADPHGDRERAVKAIVALFLAEIADLKARNKALEEGLRKLANEVGALNCAEIEVREAIGNTNWNILMGRRKESLALLTEADHGR